MAKDFINFRFLSSLYFNFKEKRIKTLNLKINNLQQKVSSEKKLLEQDLENLSKISTVKITIKDEFYSLQQFFISENKTFTIKNNNFNLKQWDNVYLTKKQSQFILVNRNDQEVFVFDSTLKDFAQYLLNLEHSFVVLSVDKNKIILQLSIKEK